MRSRKGGKAMKAMKAMKDVCKEGPRPPPQARPWLLSKKTASVRPATGDEVAAAGAPGEAEGQADAVAATGATAEPEVGPATDRPRQSAPKSHHAPPLSPRGPLTSDDVEMLENSESGNDASSDEGGELIRIVCKRHKTKEHATSWTRGESTYARCKGCINAKNQIIKFVNGDGKSYQAAWEAMGSKRNSFIAKSHHAMGEHLGAEFRKHTMKEELRSVMDNRTEGGGGAFEQPPSGRLVQRLWRSERRVDCFA